MDHARKIIDLDLYIEIFKALPSLTDKGIWIALDGFRELLKHSMDMLDTPYKLVDLMAAYKSEVAKFVMKRGNPQTDNIMSDIEKLIEDLQEYVELDEKHTVKK